MWSTVSAYLWPSYDVDSNIKELFTSKVLPDAIKSGRASGDWCDMWYSHRVNRVQDMPIIKALNFIKLRAEVSNLVLEHADTRPSRPLPKWARNGYLFERALTKQRLTLNHVVVNEKPSLHPEDANRYAIRSDMRRNPRMYPIFVRAMSDTDDESELDDAPLAPITTSTKNQGKVRRFLRTWADLFK